MRFFIFLLLLSTTLLAQVLGVSSVSGRVTDPSGGAIHNARITLIPLEGGVHLTTATNDNGDYSLSYLRPGLYDLHVEASGFSKTTARGLKADISRSIRQDIQLTFAPIETTIQVTGQSDALNTSDSSVGNVISGSIIRKLPSWGRDIVSIFAAQAGIHPTGEVNGARSDQNSLILDGSDVSSGYGTSFYSSVAINAEATEEVRIITSTPAASLSRGSGGQFTVQTRRGSNELHGSAYGYFQNAALNANGFTANRFSIPRQPYHSERYGATAGGALKPNRTFWFSAFEVNKRNQTSSVTAVVPSQSLRQGLLRFADGSGQVRTINPRDFDPRGLGANSAILSALNKYPVGEDPTVPGADGLNTMGIRFPVEVPSEFGFGLLRFDHIINSHWSFDGSARLSQQDRVGPAQLNLITRQATRVVNGYGRLVTGALNGVLTPRLTNRVQLSWMQDRWFNGGDPPATLDPIGIPADLGGSILGDIVSTGNPTRWQRGRINYYTIAENLDYRLGSHRVEAGFSYRRMQIIDLRNNKFTGGFTFPLADIGSARSVGVPDTQRPAFLTGPDTGRYNVLYSTLLGIVDNVSYLGVRDKDLQSMPPGTALGGNASAYETTFFVQDVWRIRPSLTITYGLAYGWTPPARVADDRQVMAVEAATGQIIHPLTFLSRKAQDAEAGRVYNPDIAFVPLAKLGRTGLYDTDRRNWSPRISAAWSLSPRTVVRAGYGLLYDRTTVTTMVTGPSLGYGYGEALSISPSNAKGEPFRIGIDGIPPIPSLAPAGSRLIPNPATPEAISFSDDPSLRTPRSHVFNFSIQRSLPGNSVLEVAYAGRLGRNLYQNVNLNNYPYMFREPGSGQSFAQAYDAVARELRSGVAPNAVTPQPWFENMLPGRGTRFAAAERTSDFTDGMISNLGLYFLNDAAVIPLQNRGIRDIIFRTSVGRSNYHGATITWNKRMSHGFSANLNYTYSKSLDQVGFVQDNLVWASDSFNLNRDYGPSQFDHRHLFSSLFLYELPSLSTPKRVAAALFSDWWISGIYSISSGEPISVTGLAQGFGGGTLGPYPGVAIQLAQPQGAPNPRVATAGNPANGGSGINIFADPDAAYRSFRYPLLSSDGRSSRGVLRDYTGWNVDLAVGKSMPLTERLRFSVSIELLNALNHVVWFYSNSNFNLAQPEQFGVIGFQWNSPRVIQMGCRLSW